MKPRIAFTAASHYCDYVRHLMQYYHFNFEDICTLDFYEYDVIADFPELYRSIYHQYDGFCVTGNLNLRLINSFDDLPPKPIQALTARSLEYYKTLFTMVDSDRSIDFSRVATDFSLWFQEPSPFPVPKTAEEFIHAEQLFSQAQSQLLSHVSTEDIMQTEANIVANAKELIRQKKADCILCRFPTAYRILQADNIPCTFVYPASETIIDSIHRLVGDIRLSQMNADLPAVLLITCDSLPAGELSDINSNSLSLQQALLEFDRENTARLVIRQNSQGYEIYTTQQIVKNITDNFTNCRLKTYIFSRTGLDVQIGYGIGTNVIKAKKNASDASKTARHNNKSYLITSDETLIGPLETPAQSSDSAKADSKILDAAKVSSLSISTVQRILSATEMLGSKELTTQDLATSLQVTVANAGRFLNALLKSGYAEIVSEKKSYSKGRPSRIYKILF